MHNDTTRLIVGSKKIREYLAILHCDSCGHVVDQYHLAARSKENALKRARAHWKYDEQEQIEVREKIRL